MVNVLWTAFNFHLARKGKQGSIYPLNMLYDFFLWGLLIAFGVLNMVQMLWDRRLCDGQGHTLLGAGDEEDKYARCDAAMFLLLVVELVAVNLGLLVAYVHIYMLKMVTRANR